jgi:CRP-like cAMP-binding protein
MAMSSSANGAFRNAILSRLPPETIEMLGPKPLDFELRLTFYEPNEPIEYVYFPEDGVVSVISLMENGAAIEVGTFGREGMAGSVLVLNTETVPFRYFIQIAGHGFRVSAKRFLAALAASEPLRNAVLRFESDFRTQTMQGMACNGLHSIEQRCCRWLLMTRDRLDTDDIKLTQEFLAMMLGVRRSSVTEVIAPLQELNIVRSKRGTISIVNRKALEARVCECYWVMVQRERDLPIEGN